MAKHLLWVDDEWPLLERLVARLKEQSVDTDCAESVAEGRLMMQGHDYDGFLIDMILPASSSPGQESDPSIWDRRPFLGLDLLEDIWALERKARPAVVVLTIAEDDRLLERLTRLKRKGVVDEILRKGVLRFEEVTHTVVCALGVACGQEGLGRA